MARTARRNLFSEGEGEISPGRGCENDYMRKIASIFAKQFSRRRIIEAKLPEPGGESIWSADG